MIPRWQKKRILIAVKAYPNPNIRLKEITCIAGIDRQGSWIRLYPVPYRDLNFLNRFKKYHIVEVELTGYPKDRRLETFRPNLDSIKIIGEISTGRDRSWSDRKKWVLPTITNTMCEISSLYKKNRFPSLATIKPKKVLNFCAEKAGSSWSKGQEGKLGQLSLFNPRRKTLEKIPFTFRYKYICCSSQCPGHEQSIVDWEISELYRKMRDKFGSEQTAIEKVKQRFFEQMCSQNRETYFFVGSHHRYPTFFVIGIFWPPK